MTNHFTPTKAELLAAKSLAAAAEKVLSLQRRRLLRKLRKAASRAK